MLRCEGEALTTLKNCIDKLECFCGRKRGLNRSSPPRADADVVDHEGDQALSGGRRLRARVRHAAGAQAPPRQGGRLHRPGPQAFRRRGTAGETQKIIKNGKIGCLVS